MARLLFWVALGPLGFLAAIALYSVVLVARGLPPEAVAPVIEQNAAAVLMAVLLVMGGFALLHLRWRDLGRGGGWGLGVVVGAGLALAYLTVLAPALTWAQLRFGDYVPAGAVLATVSGQIGLFLVANVLLAPAVEELIYRGRLLEGFSARYGRGMGVVLSCVAFGLLHWTGGFWYMVLTAIVAGVPLAWLALRSGGLAAPFAAHLTLNLIEFAYAAN